MEISWKLSKGTQYGTLRDDAGELVISATLGYVLKAVIVREYEVSNLKEAIVAYITFQERGTLINSIR